MWTEIVRARPDNGYLNAYSAVPIPHGRGPDDVLDGRRAAGLGSRVAAHHVRRGHRRRDRAARPPRRRVPGAADRDRRPATSTEFLPRVRRRPVRPRRGMAHPVRGRDDAAAAPPSLFVVVSHLIVDGLARDLLIDELTARLARPHGLPGTRPDPGGPRAGRSLGPGRGPQRARDPALAPVPGCLRGHQLPAAGPSRRTPVDPDRTALPRSRAGRHGHRRPQPGDHPRRLPGPLGGGPVGPDRAPHRRPAVHVLKPPHAGRAGVHRQPHLGLPGRRRGRRRHRRRGRPERDGRRHPGLRHGPLPDRGGARHRPPVPVRHAAQRLPRGRWLPADGAVRRPRSTPPARGPGSARPEPLSFHTDKIYYEIRHGPDGPEPFVILDRQHLPVDGDQLLVAIEQTAIGAATDDTRTPAAALFRPGGGRGAEPDERRPAPRPRCGDGPAPGLGARAGAGGPRPPR